MKYNKMKLIDLLSTKHYTNKLISSKVGLHENMVGRLSRGESMPSLESLTRFAEFFSKDMNYFFDDVKTHDTLVTSDPLPEYGNNPWQILYEKQLEITDLKAEIERLKKGGIDKN